MKIFTRIMLVLALAGGLFAQQPARSATDQPSRKEAESESRPPENFYKLNFVIYELEDGKKINQRDYMMISKTNASSGSSIRVSTRVPVYAEDKKMQYVDAGLNIRCPIKEQTANKLQIECDVEISSFVKPEQLAGSGTAGPAAPVMRSSRTSSWALLTLGKPAVLTTFDDVNSTKRMQIEVTATKMD
jgi:hypothetical protein